jgi:hypothetical protein
VEQLEDRAVPATINGVAFYDLNSNGVQDTGEGFAAGVAAALSGSGVSANTTTDASGYYEFAGLGSGSYAVSFTPPAGYAVDNPESGSALVNIQNPSDTVGIGVGLISSGSGSGSGSVSVEKIDDATEGGTAGLLRFTRTGDLTSALPVNYTVGGTATSGTDYTALSGSVTFAAGASTADVTVTALDDDVYDDDESVTVTVTTGTGYTIGSPSSDSVRITDDVDSLESVIYQESFQLTGANGSVDVVLQVVYNAPGAAGLYTWTYTVTNPATNTTSWTDFSIPVEGMDTDVGNLTNDLGWSSTVGTDAVSWSNGSSAALAPGATGTFSFTTDPREIGSDTVTVSNGGLLADAPAPKPGPKSPAPYATLGFFSGRNKYNLTLSITIPLTGSPKSRTYQTDEIGIDQNSPELAARQVYNYLKAAEWAVTIDGSTITITGVNINGTVFRFTSMTSTVANLQKGVGFSDKPDLTKTGAVTVINN